LGSGGGGARIGADAGATPGGGIIAIFAIQADILGTLNVRGGDGGASSDWAGGCGSGGSVLLQAATLNMTSPTILATGGVEQAPFTNAPGGEGRVAIYYNTLGGSMTGIDVTPYTEDDLELPYYIQGTTSHDCEIRIYDSEWTFVRSEQVSAGIYTLTNLPNDGPFIVLAEADAGAYNILGYKAVTSAIN
jgi:hypothetical protein